MTNLKWTKGGDKQWFSNYNGIEIEVYKAGAGQWQMQYAEFGSRDYFIDTYSTVKEAKEAAQNYVKQIPRVEFIEYGGYCIESAPKGYWVTEEFEGEQFIKTIVESIEEAKEYINQLNER